MGERASEEALLEPVFGYCMCVWSGCSCVDAGACVLVWRLEYVPSLVEK